LRTLYLFNKFQIAKVFKLKVLKITGYIITGIITFLLTFMLLLRNPLAQTIFARMATTYLTHELNTEIALEKLDISLFKKLELSNLLIKDLKQDTLLYTHQLSVTLDKPLLFIKKFKPESVVFEDGDFRLRNYSDIEGSNLQFLIDYFSPSDSMKKDSTSIDITLDRMKFRNFRFSYINENKEKSPGQIDFNDIDIKDLNLNASHIEFIRDSLSLVMHQLSFREKSGFKLDSLSADFIVCSNMIEAMNLAIKTGNNDIDLDLRFSFNDFNDFNDFINSIDIRAKFRPSIINLAEVGYFAPVMYTMNNEIRLTGDIKGTVSNFKARDLKFATGQTTQFRGDIQMNGLPEIKETFTHLSISNLTTSIDDIRYFRLPNDDIYIDIPHTLDPAGNINIVGKFTGFYNDFVSYAKFNTDVGFLSTDLLLRVNKNKEIEYHGKLAAKNFQAGLMFNTGENIGQLDLTANIDGSGLEFENMNITMEGEINSFRFFDNVYNKIKLNGTLADKKFTGTTQVRDDNMNLDFAGLVDYSHAIPKYNFTANIKDAYLQQINLIPGDDSSRISTNLNINFIGNDLDNMQGIIILDSTIYFQDGKKYTMDDFTFSVTRDSTEYGLIRIFSDIFDATMEGEFTIRELPFNFAQIANFYLDTLITDINWDSLHLDYQDFVFNIELKNTEPLTQLFIPDLVVAPGTWISGGFNSRIQNLFFDGGSEEIDFRKQKLMNWYTDFYVADDNIHLTTGVDEFYLSDTLVFDSLKIDLKGARNTIKYQIGWKDDKDRYAVNKGSIAGLVKMLGSDRYKMEIENAQVVFYDTVWSVVPGNYIQYDTNLVRFRHLELVSKQQRIAMHGNLSDNPADTLKVEFEDFKLSNLDMFLKNVGIDMDGNLNGNIQVINFFSNPFYLSNIKVNNFYFNKEKLGNADIQTIWDPGIQAFNIKGNIIYIGNIGSSETLNIEGKYYPRKKDHNFDIAVDLNKYKLKTLEPFTRSFSSDIEGLATGSLKLEGSIKKPVLTGKIILADAAMRIDYLNVKYFFAGTVPVDSNRFVFNDLIVFDSLTNQADLSGEISHNYFRDFRIDLNINTNLIAALNTTRSQNELFYGDAFASGYFHIYGPFSNLNFDINARSEKGSNVKIPVSYGTEVGTNDYIVFVNDEQKKEEQETPRYNVSMKGIQLNLGLNVTNETDIQLFMPYNMGNIKARGKGDVKMEVSPTGVFTMDGEYTIDRGFFFFTLQNIINRNFNISRGSSITWSGDPYNAKIDMKAVYKVKTTLGDYGPPQDSATRVPVDCIIGLSGQLLNPEIRFTVEFPDLKDDTKQYIYSRLDTTDQAMMSQQMISLLVLNNFSSPTGNTGSVGFNTFSFITNQLNNWLSQISNDFDIGVNYRPGDNMSAQEMEVALSTQLWDERVLIDGNVGVKGTDNTENTNNIVGEVTVEVKITPDGRFRAKAFNKSNNDILYKNYAPYTQGVGVFYTQEFNKFSDLFGRKEEKKKSIKSEDQSSIK